MRVPPALAAFALLLAGCVGSAGTDAFSFSGVLFPQGTAADLGELADLVRVEGGEMSIDEKIGAEFVVTKLDATACRQVRGFAASLSVVETLAECAAPEAGTPEPTPPEGPLMASAPIASATLGIGPTASTP